MITLSNIDAEKVLEYITFIETHEKESMRIKGVNSIKDYNRIRMLRILKNKISKKLNKVSQERGANCK